ncbi:MAG: VanZ family protein [Cyanobacteria bacterium J06600_6]
MQASLNLIKQYWLFCTLLILTLITILSLRPLDSLPPVPGTDKTHHVIAYGVLMLPTAIRKPKHWLLIALLFAVFSGVIELIQPYVNRYGELEDLLANIAGLACGLVIAKILRSFLLADVDPD